jgi:hypothetical protein
MTGETVVKKARQHWMALFRYALIPTLVLGAVIVLLIIGLSIDGGNWFTDFANNVLGWITTAGFWVGAIWFGIMAFRWTKREYVLTNRRVLRVDGVMRKSVDGNALDMINDVGFKQSMVGRVLDYGSVEIATASGSPTEFPMIKDAQEFKTAVLDAQQAIKDGRLTEVRDAVAGGAAQGPAAAAPPAAQDITAALNNLADLRDRGALTPEEFEAKKAELLARL